MFVYIQWNLNTHYLTQKKRKQVFQLFCFYKNTSCCFGFGSGWIQIRCWAKAPLSTGFEYMHSNRSRQQNYTGNSITVKLNDHRNVGFNLDTKTIRKFPRKRSLLKKCPTFVIKCINLFKARLNKKK